MNLRLFILLSLLLSSLMGNAQFSVDTDFWRPSIHFTPQKNWTNDPNGLIYYKGEYHLFFQHNPKGFQWGNMSWGHAKSSDLMHWEELPLAIPNGEEFIFSGSVVWDKNHASGLGDPNKDLLVAIYTADYPYTREEQHIAYSNDDGITWTKYANNPVLNIDYKDFRDPNVFWHEDSQQFIMAVAKPHEFTIQFYGSYNLIDWKWLSDFKNAGNTNMIWECPALMKLPVENEKNKEKWVLTISAEGPYLGFVGMQYFVGDFDGKEFQLDENSQAVNYVDFGKDFYAAIPFSETQGLWLGWFNSWKYAKFMPTFPYNGQMSFPRTLKLIEKQNQYQLKQIFTPDFQDKDPDFEIKNLKVKKLNQLNGLKFMTDKTYGIHLKAKASSANEWGFIIQSKKNKKEFTRIYVDEEKNLLRVDRSFSGKNIHEDFLSNEGAYLNSHGLREITILVDHSMVEILAQNGTIALSSLRFPLEENENIYLYSKGGQTKIDLLQLWDLD